MGHMRVMATARAASIVPFAQRDIIWLVEECPETNLEYQSQYNGNADFKAPAKAGKWMRAKPVGEMCFFFVTILVSRTISMVPNNLGVWVRCDGLVVHM